MKHPNAIGIREGLGYMFGDIGNLLVLTFISTYLKVFYTDSLMVGYDAAKVYNDITVLFLVTRLWDAINDPLWGLIVDSRAPKPQGKFRPYIKFVSIPLGISTILCFLEINKFISSYIVLLIFAYITYTAFGMLYTGMNIPYGSLASVITDDPKGRTLLSTFRSIGGGVGGAPVTLIGQMIIYDKVKDASGATVSSSFNGTKAFYLAVFFGVVSAIMYLVCYKSTKERVKSPTEKKKIDVKLTYGSLFKSIPFLTVTVSGILISGLLQYVSFNQYLFKNYFGNSDLSVVNTLCTYAPMAALILFVPKLVEKFGKKELCIFGLTIASLASIFNAVFLPSAPVYFVMQALTGLGYSFMSITNWAIVMDVIDYQEVRTGSRDDGTVYAVYSFARKLGQALAGGVVGFALAAIGYVSSTGHVVQTQPVREGIYTISTLVPGLSYLGVFLVLLLAYPLTKKRVEENAAVLRERRGEAAQEP